METIIKPFQLGIAAQLIDNYKGDIPFSNYFNEQCKQHRNWGSRDRKIYRQACFAYLRLGFANQLGSTESTIRFALQPTEELLKQIDIRSIFPHKDYVSTQISYDDWCRSFLYQKPIYLAIVRGNEAKTENYLKQHGLEYSILKERTFKLKANTNCDEILRNGWAWIMDISSQEVASEIKINQNDKVWDCCSGAGGKALYITNENKQAFNLTCSDARFSILENLKDRFRQYHFSMPAIELCNLNEPFHIKDRYNTIIADVPCSGSGTWGRTPENITRIDFEKIIFYAKLQRTIVDNARKNLLPGGRLYYITCSVFKEENELNVRYFEEKSGLKLIAQGYKNAIINESDWLYFAVLEKL